MSTTTTTTTTAPDDAAESMLAASGEAAATAAKADAKAEAKADKAAATAATKGFTGVTTATTKAVTAADAVIAAAMAIDTAHVTAATLPASLRSFHDAAGDDGAAFVRSVATTLVLLTRAGDAIIAAYNKARTDAGESAVYRHKVTRTVVATPIRDGLTPLITKDDADAGVYGFGWSTLIEVIDAARLAQYVAAAYADNAKAVKAGEARPMNAKAVIAAARRAHLRATDATKADARDARDKARADAREARKAAAKDVATGITPDGSGAADDKAAASMTSSVDDIVGGLTAAIAAAAAAGKVDNLIALRALCDAAIDAARAAAKAAKAAAKRPALTVVKSDDDKAAADASADEAAAS